MKAKKFLVILSLLAVALFVVACDCAGNDTTAANTDPVVTTTEATTTAATTTEATTTVATTTVATTTKVTTTVTTTKATTTAATTPAPVVPNDPYLWNGNVAVAFAGGTGTAEDPYQIANGAQLALMAETFEKGAYYILVDDIMLNDVYNFENWSSIDTLMPLNEWKPIEGFNANFDGKGKTIYGLFGTPLFATTKDASITNFGFAYTDVDGAVLAGTATDTNIAGITIDTATLVLDGKTDIVIPENAIIDDIMAITGTKWLVTLGNNPDVWTFEGLAAGALATDLFVANDKLGTSFNVTIVDGKGYVENDTDGKKALAWDANDANGNTLVLNIAKDNTASTNWSGADEVLVYVDGSEQEGAYKFGISLVDAAGKTWTLAKDKEVSTLDGKAWFFFKSTGANFELEDGYTGWVRVPFSAFTDGAEGKIDTNNFNVAQIAFYYENASAVDAGNFYIDSVKILDADGAWKALPNTIPTLAPIYGITTLQNFTNATAEDAWVKAGQEAAVSATIVDGKVKVEAITGFADSYFKVGANVPTDTKGFLVYVDADIVEKAATGGSNANVKPTTAFKLGFRLQIDGQYYSIGGTQYSSENVLAQNDAWALCSDGNWARIANVNNNRMPLPEDDFTGWVYLPADSLSQVTYPGPNINQKFLSDYLATKTGDVKMTQVELYITDGNAGSSFTLDNLMAVAGESASLTLGEDAPATLPDGLGYSVSQIINYETTDLFFNNVNYNKVTFENADASENPFATANGNVVAEKGKDATGALKVATAESNGWGRATTNFRAGNGIAPLALHFNDSGFMFYVDASELEAKEGKDFVSLKLVVRMAPYASSLRSDDAAGINYMGGNYWTFHFSKIKGEVPAYVLDEEGKWTAVYNNTDAQYVDIPEGYKGYMYIPFTSLTRNGSSKVGDDLYNHGNGMNGQHIFLRSYDIEFGQVANGGAAGYIDQFSIVEGTRVNAEQTIPTTAPAKLPGDVSYELVHRIGFEDESEFAWINGNANDYYFSTDRAVSGNAISFTPYLSTDNKTSRGEMYIGTEMVVLKDTGVKGVMFYVDFSQVTSNQAYGVCATITINSNDYRSNAEGAKAYYMAKGATTWTETAPANGDRMGLPAAFAGWVYIPIESYKAGAADQSVTYIRLYTDGYEYDCTKYVTFDELMYVK